MKSISQRLPVLQHIFDPLLRLLARDQFHEVLALQVEQPLFVHEAARVHVATADGLGHAAADVVVVFGDEASFEHVDHGGLERGDAGASADLYLAVVQGRAVGAGVERFGFFLGDVQQLEAV